MQIYKYCVHQGRGNKWGKTATFMPKPVVGDNGSGMHVHQSLWRGRQAAVRRQPAMPTCRKLRLYYIGGIIKHAKSHQRLLERHDQQLQAADPRLRGAGAARLLGAQPLGVVPDPLCRLARTASASRSASPTPRRNPYYTFTAMLMAGLDGIQNKIHPGDPMDKDLYDLPPEELTDIPTVCGSLREALEAHRRRPRLPQEGRGLQRRPDRRLHRPQMGRGLLSRTHDAPGRVRNVLQRVGGGALYAGHAKEPRPRTAAFSKTLLNFLKFSKMQLNNIHWNCCL